MNVLLNTNFFVSQFSYKQCKNWVTCRLSGLGWLYVDIQVGNVNIKVYNEYLLELVDLVVDQIVSCRPGCLSGQPEQRPPIKNCHYFRVPNVRGLFYTGVTVYWYKHFMNQTSSKQPGTRLFHHFNLVSGPTVRVSASDKEFEKSTLFAADVNLRTKSWIPDELKDMIVPIQSPSKAQGEL